MGQKVKCEVKGFGNWQTTLEQEHVLRVGEAK